jgi:hypothetical protein
LIEPVLASKVGTRDARAVVGLLRSLPEAARLKINMLDEPDPNHEATFPLAGLDAVRGKIAAACQWPPVANTMPSEKG